MNYSTKFMNYVNAGMTICDVCKFRFQEKQNINSVNFADSNKKFFSRA